MPSKKKPLLLQPEGKVVRFKKSHLNDPQIVEHARLGRELLKQVGLPKELLGQQKSC